MTHVHCTMQQQQHTISKIPSLRSKVPFLPTKDFVMLNEVFRLLCGQTSLITTQHFKYTVVRGFSNSKGIFVAFFIIYQILSGPTTPVRFMCCSGLQRGCGIRLQEEPSRCRQRIYFPWYKLVHVLGSMMCTENAPFFFLSKREMLLKMLVRIHCPV